MDPRTSEPKVAKVTGQAHLPSVNAETEQSQRRKSIELKFSKELLAETNNEIMQYEQSMGNNTLTTHRKGNSSSYGEEGDDKFDEMIELMDKEGEADDYDLVNIDDITLDKKDPNSLSKAEEIDNVQYSIKV